MNGSVQEEAEHASLGKGERGKAFLSLYRGDSAEAHWAFKGIESLERSVDGALKAGAVGGTCIMSVYREYDDS